MKIEKKAAFNGPETQSKTLMRQVAALCLREGETEQDVLLVTSSENRWILPKGWPMEGKTDAEAAEIEAWEEAGVRAASVTDDPVASFIVDKETSDGVVLPCHLDVFEVKVDEMAKDFPERDKRKRQWLPLSKAAKVVEAPSLRHFFKKIA